MARRTFASCKVPRAAARVGRRRQCRLLRRQSLSRRGRMSAGADFDNIIERERGLRRELSARRLTMIAIGGAIGTGLFLGSGFAISLAGPGVLVSYAIGAVIALLLMGCLAEMTVAHPTSGSFGAYAEYYIGPLAGFLVRYAYWTCIVLAVGTEVTAVALYMRFWFPTLPGWLWILAFSALLIGVNARSVNVFGAIEYWFSAIKVTAIVIFILLASYIVLRAPSAVPAAAADVSARSGAAAIGFQNYTAHGGFLPRGVWGAWVAVIVAIFSYLSIEMIAVAAGEAAQPEVAVTRAFRSTVLRLIRFYLVTFCLVLAIVFSIVEPKSAFILMVSISGFGAMFTWMMIFITHYRFRRVRARQRAAPLRFRMVGFPATTLLGAALMAAVLVTTALTDAFRMTLIFGLPFLALLSAAYWISHRQHAHPAAK